MKNKTFEELSRASLRSLYRHGTVQSIGISSDFKTVRLITKNHKVAKIIVAKKAVEVLSEKGVLTKELIIQSSIVLLDDCSENRLRFYINEYTDLSEIFTDVTDSEKEDLKMNNVQIISLELEKYWIIPD